MAIRLRPLDDASAPAWDAFVAAMPDGTFFHRAAWAQVIESAFGHRSHYTLAEQDGAIVGVLPLVHVRSRLFGNTLISTPFCVYGGPLAVDRETAAALEDHCQRFARTPRRLARSNCVIAHAGRQRLVWSRPDLYVTFRKPIVGDHDRNMKAIPRKQRAMVRKGIQNGLSSVSHRDVAVLHRIYAESVRNLGTPVFSRRYFAILRHDVQRLQRYRHGAGRGAADCLGDEFLLSRRGAALLRWRHSGGPPAGGKRLHVLGSDASRRRAGLPPVRFRPQQARHRRLRLQTNWGFTPAPLHYRYRLAPGAAIPDHNPLNPKYRLFIAAWKRLPLPVANLLGPPIVRGLG